MEEPLSSSEEGSSLDEPTWVSWFCMLRNHEFFCEVDPGFIQDRFNLYGLKEVVGPLYGEAMTMILGYAPTEKQLSDPTQRIHKVLETARTLYGLIHARYILTAQGLSDMKAKYKAHDFGSCPRTLCEKQPVLPVGLCDQVSVTGDNSMKLFCARCQELYDQNVPGCNYIDGAYFGTTFPHLFLQSFRELRPPPQSRRYVPRVFGFKVHHGHEPPQQPPPREEWPKRPKNEPVSDWDS
jgi:casein kinase II subunit beta